MKTQTKQDRIRLASKLVWFIGLSLTINFFLSITEAASIWMTAFIVVSCAATQYCLTIAESALFDGKLPPPWRVAWSEMGKEAWLTIGAISCLLLDVILNLGGIAFILGQMVESSSGDAMRNMYGFADSIITAISQVLVILFSVVIASGSELLNTYADYLDELEPSITDSNRIKKVP